MDRAKPENSRERTPRRDDALVEPEPDADVQDPNAREPIEPNPPRTTTGKITSPKFGSAGSGGAELEPGPPRP